MINGTNFTTAIYSTDVDNREPKKELDKDDFLNLLVTQLKYQDPLNPLDNNEFIAQTTQFSVLEQLINISEKADKLIESDNNNTVNLFSAVGFLGKTINFYGNDFFADETGADLRFDVSGQPSETILKIYNGDGALVKEVPIEAVDGSNYFHWDLTDKDGIKLDPGAYSFDITVKDQDGNELPVRQYSSGKVVGVLQENGTTMFDLGFAKVKPEEIISVYN